MIQFLDRVIEYRSYNFGEIVIIIMWAIIEAISVSHLVMQMSLITDIVKATFSRLMHVSAH